MVAWGQVSGGATNAGCARSTLTCGGRTKSARRSGRHVARRQGRVEEVCTKKALLLRLLGQICEKEISLNLTRGTGRQEGDDGDWVERRAERNKFEFAKRSDGGDSEKKFWKGNGNDVLSATEGNTESRDGGGECDWGKREGGSRDLGMTDAGKRSACRKRERIRCFSLVAAGTD